MSAREWLADRARSMSARARRHEAVEDAKIWLAYWRDSGDPRDLDTAIQRLRSEADA